MANISSLVPADGKTIARFTQGQGQIFSTVLLWAVVDDQFIEGVVLDQDGNLKRVGEMPDFVRYGFPPRK